MGLDERIKLIEKIEEERNSRVIAYITGDRFGIPPAQIGEDILPRLKEFLSKIGKTEKIDLFLYSRGGMTNVPWMIVSLIREYANNFSVLIPFRAHSAATMIALGADEIVCGPAAQLGPIDPSITTPFNPIDQQGRLLEVGTETVRAYMEFLNNSGDFAKLGFDKLLNTLNPLALGEIYRNHYYIRNMAMKILSLHNGGKLDQKERENIVKKLVEEMYYHGHAITRKEAKEIGLNIVEADEKLEKLMWQLYADYAEEMKLNLNFSPLSFLMEKKFQPTILQEKIAFLESKDSSYIFNVKLLLEPIRQNPPQLLLNINYQLPQDLLQIIQQNPDLNQIIRVILERLQPYIPILIQEELEKQMPIIDLKVRLIEGNWKKVR